MLGGTCGALLRAQDAASDAGLALSPRPSREQGYRTSGIDAWFARVSKTQAEQPHWITPLVTVTPRLEEEFRFDVLHQAFPDGSSVDSYGGGKGLELIPQRSIEIILGLPAYLDREPQTWRDGIGDTSFLLKYRVLSANEQNGNYILTFFLGASAPTATKNNGTGHTVFTPTVAFGKGFGPFDVQTTLGIGIPTGGRHLLGTPVVHNLAFQYHLLKKLWPELEVNTTWWPNGAKDGKKQVFLTPGFIIGKLPLWKRMGLTFGAGVQQAVSDYRTYAHSLVFTVRLPF